MELEQIGPSGPDEAAGSRPWWRRWRDTDAGQTLVEFSMILPFMLILLFALVDFGRGFYSWLLVTNGAREGARAGATQLSQAEIEQRVMDSLCSDFSSGDCGIDETKLAIQVNNAQGQRGTPVDVDLTYQFEFVTPIGDLLAFIGGSSISAPTITAHASMRLE